jgi:hypothetical protein
VEGIREREQGNVEVWRSTERIFGSGPVERGIFGPEGIAPIITLFRIEVSVSGWILK